MPKAIEGIATLTPVINVVTVWFLAIAHEDSRSVAELIIETISVPELELEWGFEGKHVVCTSLVRLKRLED